MGRSSTIHDQDPTWWGPLHSSTVEKSKRRTQDQDQRCQSGPSAKDSVIPSEGDSLNIYVWGRPTMHNTSNVCLLENKIQDWRMYLFTVSYGSYAMEQRSWDRWISGWHRNSNTRFWGTRRENSFSTEQNHPLYPIQKKGQSGGTRKPKKRTVSFSEDRSLTWFTNTFGSLEPMILSRTVPTHSLLFFKMMIFRNSIRNGTKFYCQWRKSHLMISWKDCTN